MAGLPALSDLRLRAVEQLRTLPDWLAGLPSLGRLDVSQNEAALIGSFTGGGLPAPTRSVRSRRCCTSWM